jgi:EAL domain-containing protein (putative c-di-GMP-specific phosphodiesterase class I)
LEVLRRAIHDSGIDPNNLELEITESVAMEDTDFILSVLSQINGLHVSIAIDDFGTGYSSLSKLRLLPIDRLKIDRAFVNELDLPAKGYIAETIIELAENFDLQVIAEGIETAEQERKLKELGCHEGQGYLYSKPLDAQQLRAWLKTF